MSDDSIDGKTVAVLLMATTEAGEADWWVMHGTFRFANGRLFIERASGPPFPVEAEWLSRLKPVAADQAEILGPSELLLPLTVGPIPEGTDRESLLFTGLTLR